MRRQTKQMLLIVGVAATLFLLAQHTGFFEPIPKHSHVPVEQVRGRQTQQLILLTFKPS